MSYVTKIQYRDVLYFGIHIAEKTWKHISIRNLKENPNVQGNLLKMQHERSRVQVKLFVEGDFPSKVTNITSTSRKIGSDIMHLVLLFQSHQNSRKPLRH